MSETPLKYKILDVYLKRPVIFDILLSGGAAFLAKFLIERNYAKIASLSVVESLATDFISVTISLAGFVLAALTIIVTFKDSIDSSIKHINEAKSGKELFFKSNSYFTSIKVFYKSAFELITLFMFMVISKLFCFEISILWKVMIGVFIVSIITLIILRSIGLLILITKLQGRK